MTEPTQMMCFLNPVSVAGLHRSIVELEVTPRESFYGRSDSDNGFAMSNAVYYDTNKNLKRAVDVTGKFFETEDQARAALNARATAESGSGGTTEAGTELTSEEKVIDVYVERYAAKVKFSYPESTNKINLTLGDKSTDGFADEGTETTSTYSVKFVPEAWAVNATNTENFVTKSFRSSASGGGIAGDNAPYNIMDDILNKNSAITDEEEKKNAHTNWKWNDPANLRSYWGCSPAYYNSSYPEVSCDVTAQSDYKIRYVMPESDNTDTDNVMEKNFTNGQIATGKNIQYVMESTIGRTALYQSNNPAAAIPSAVLYGHYEFYEGDTKLQVDDKDVTFYTVNSGSTKTIYFENDNTGYSKLKKNNSPVGQSILEYLIRTNPSIRLKKIESNAKAETYSQVSVTAAAALGAVKHPTPEVLNGIKLASQKVCYQLDETNLQSTSDGSSSQLIYEDNGEKYVFCIADNNTGKFIEVGTGSYEANKVTVNRISVINANRMFVQYRGKIMPEAYKEGDAWYNIPIYHLGWHVGTNPNMKDGKPVSPINYSKVRIGDFGLVRNHVYDIEVTGISGLGIGILDPTDPLVPPSETETKAVAYKINIENWAVVPKQSVTL